MIPFVVDGCPVTEHGWKIMVAVVVIVTFVVLLAG